MEYIQGNDGYRHKIISTYIFSLLCLLKDIEVKEKILVKRMSRKEIPES